MVKNNLNKIIWVVIVLVLLGAAYFLSGGNFFPSASLNAGNSSSVPMNIVTINDKSNKIYTLNIEYPQFPALSKVLNDSISSFVNNDVKEFKLLSLENWKARQDTTPVGQPIEQYPKYPFYLNITWQSKQINQNYISFLLRSNAFVGGANEIQTIKAFNLDVRVNKIMALADLFPQSADYLSVISGYVYDDLYSSLNNLTPGHVETTILKDGTAPKADNYANFLFDDNVVDFYFPKTTVAPGAYGEQHVIVPRTIIK